MQRAAEINKNEHQAHDQGTDGHNFTDNHHLVQIFVADDADSIGADEQSFTLTVTPAPGVDSDGDGVFDDLDNCINTANADQRDTNSDGFGNLCDADFNNDCVINVVDLGVLRSGFFGAPGPSAWGQTCN